MVEGFAPVMHLTPALVGSRHPGLLGNDQWRAQVKRQQGRLLDCGDEPRGGQGQGESQITLEQDPNVLDTWFSSALYPFSRQEPRAGALLPGSLAGVTGHDILFLCDVYLEAIKPVSLFKNIFNIF